MRRRTGAVPPGDLVAAGVSDRPDRRPVAELTNRHVGAVVLQRHPGAGAVQHRIFGPDKAQCRRAVHLDDLSKFEAGGAVAVEVLLEAGLEVFQGHVGARHDTGEASGVGAAAVGLPDDVLRRRTGAVPPRDLVAARRKLLGSDRRPGAKFTNRHRAPLIGQRRPGPTAAEHGIMGSNLNQARRAK